MTEALSPNEPTGDSHIQSISATSKHTRPCDFKTDADVGHAGEFRIKLTENGGDVNVLSFCTPHLAEFLAARPDLLRSFLTIVKRAFIQRKEEDGPSAWRESL